MPKEKRQKKQKKSKQEYSGQRFRRNLIRMFWVILILSIVVAAVTNFTARKTHEVRTEVMVENHVSDTEGIKNFVRNFTKAYHEYSTTQESIDGRNKLLSNYMTDNLVSLNRDTIRKDEPITSKINVFEIWEVEQKSNEDYTVTYFQKTDGTTDQK